MPEYVQLKALVKSGYKPFKDMPANTRTAQIKAVQYIETLATTTGTKIDNWDIFKIFAKPNSKTQVVTDKNKINKIFFANVPAASDVQNPSAKEKSVRVEPHKTTRTLAKIAAAVKKIHEFTHQDSDKAYNIWTQSRSSARYMMKEAQRHLILARSAYADYKGGRHVSEEFIGQQIEQTIGGGFWEFVGVEDGVISFATRNNIIVSHSNPKAKVNLRVNLGKFKVHYYLDGGEGVIAVEEKSGNIEIDDCIHPHVEGGVVCWGNASDRVCEAVEKYEISVVMALLQSILCSYNDANPYIELDSFQKESMKSAPPGLKVESLTCSGCEMSMSDCECGEEEEY